MDLNEEERQVLFALAGHLSVADGRVDLRERAELQALAEELEVPLAESLAEATRRHPTADAAVAAAANVRRVARDWIRTALMDLATADGARGGEENDLVARITREWARVG